MSSGNFEGSADESVSKPRRRAKQGDNGRKAAPHEGGSRSAESRSFPRIAVPMLVTATHPSFGSRECLIENISEDGVLLRIDAPDLGVGAQLKLTLLSTSAVEHEATPTVAMTVARVAEHGLGLSFASASARHLWKSADRRRRELVVGLDYFQVQLNLLIIADQRLLLLARQGRWLLPNRFLQVGQDMAEAAMQTLHELGCESPTLGPVIGAESLSLPNVPETATLCVYQQVRLAAPDISLSQDSPYAEHRWISQARKLRELTLATPGLESIVAATLEASASTDQPGDQSSSDR